MPGSHGIHGAYGKCLVATECTEGTANAWQPRNTRSARQMPGSHGIHGAHGKYLGSHGIHGAHGKCLVATEYTERTANAWQPRNTRSARQMPGSHGIHGAHGKCLVATEYTER